MPEGSTSAAGIDLDLIRSGIRLMALRALGDADLADEVAQESLVRAIDVLRLPDGALNVGAYVAGIARHVIADHFRARQRVVSLDQAIVEEIPDGRADALTLLCSAGERLRVRDALAQLSADDRELMRLSYFEGLTPTEIAQQLGVPADRVRQRKLRALLRLRAAFDGAIPSRHAGRPEPTITAGITLNEARRSTE
jgi:RNA polymerase sigma-70 factor (ECF subfamily)